MFELDLRSRLPIYEQLIEKMKQLIISEVLKPDEQLPSVRALAQQLTINPNTIQKAYRELEREGFIYTIQGKGNFVASIIQSKHQEKKETLKKELMKILSEAMYLGMSREEILQLISNAEEIVGGDKGHD
ncbi:GntR family transcriptional regulator [Alkaliphilus serpentinus]|uniref:GntR family transcriptional regulator n=1 Tax=Alkaliphilus serpentinus TaxID=1482731 RepID=A0A833HNY5_9FIRM|nr:GntR family transcriptional regulator [Alkaliphilus serpentinus]KAB3530051.1 GntR family transcriptional regulator [Alkaliphilus serpentinus]